ncbi:MAG: siroheme synthase CysG [Pseudomonadota bacterium]
MNHFPIFVALEGRRVLVGGGGDAAVAKLRLLLKTTAHITVIAEDFDSIIEGWAAEGKLRLIHRAPEPGDALCCVLAYAAYEDDGRDAAFFRLATADGAMVNVVDNLEQSQFITPAMVDRDPVVVAIGTEGAAPVLARKIKADLEEQLPVTTGFLAQIGKSFRKAANALPMGPKRRKFWADYYDTVGPRAAEGDEQTVQSALETLLAQHLNTDTACGHVDLVGAGPGDPDLLTLKARKSIDKADVIIHDRLVSKEILELARREALIIDAGKAGFGPAMSQSEINDLLVEHGTSNAHVVRLKGGDPTLFGRLDEEVDALESASISWAIIPGITAASAAVAAIGQSLTKRQRNGSVRFLTGHDMQGFADQDWKTLAQPGEVAAIYMGKRASRWLQGRLPMHGASPQTSVSVVENVSRADQRILTTDLATLPKVVATATGPALILFGLAPRQAAAQLPQEVAL